MVSSSERKISFATVGRAHGVRGEVRVFLDDPSYSFFTEGGMYELRDATGEHVCEVHVKTLREVHGCVLVTCAEITQREDWQKWGGGRLCCDPEELEDLPSGSAYMYELEGCELQNAEGLVLGRVLDVRDNAGQALLRVDTPEGERLFPLVPQTFADFDRDARVLKVHFIEGVWDV